MWKNRGILGLLCVVLVLVLSGDAIATPNDGSQGPAPSGGGGGKKSVPAPFGILFLGTATLAISFVKRHASLFKVSDILTAFALCFAVQQEALTLPAAFLILLPVIASNLLNRDSDTWRGSFLFYSVLTIALSVVAFAPQWSGVALSLCVMLRLLNSGLPQKTKTVLSLSLFATIFTMQPLVAPADTFLQNLYTSVVVLGLQNLGVPVFQEGNQILGLATEIKVTQACVGSSVLAHTVALVCFVSALFVRPDRQATVAVQMTGVVLLLNAFRIGVITYLGNTFFAAHFDVMHLQLGLMTACISYLFIATWTYRSTKTSPMR